MTAKIDEKTEVGRRKMEDGRRKKEDGRRRTAKPAVKLIPGY
ncbi:MAG: hypothetical protein NTV01_00850 [Bacteroidia bacterium]|nr:hypothetical protein [Bacteroidia bacterium]